jgi:hypothetical protein
MVSIGKMGPVMHMARGAGAVVEHPERFDGIVDVRMNDFSPARTIAYRVSPDYSVSCSYPPNPLC